MAVDRTRAAAAVEEFLRALGHDPSVGDLRETGARVAEAWADDLVAGEDVDVGALLRAESFDVNGEGGDVVILRDVPIATMCPHHLLPAMGTATIAYGPGARVAGLGTIARAVDAFARRLTLQETIGQRVVASLVSVLGAKGAACAIRLRHACLVARGERKDAWVETLATAGALAPGGTHAALLASIAQRDRG